MAESYLASQVDTRTFGQQQTRLLSDLNRPDLSGEVINYLQDAMRWAQRYPYFFNDVDNTTTLAWAASTTYPQGTTIQATASDGNVYAVVALNAGVSGTVTPIWPITLFTTPSSAGTFPPPASGTAGTIDDNTIRWGSVANLTSSGQTQNYWTQLSTVYAINQYVPPIDYVAPRLIEVTAASLRYRLVEVPYGELREYDVIRPAPITTYPTFWAWFQQQIYLWPYPSGFYPLTLSFHTAPQLAVNATDTNFWTTKAESLIRAYAEYLIQLKLLKDPDAAQMALTVAMRELNALQAQMNAQTALQGIPPDLW
jgi:hypothetical protein